MVLLEALGICRVYMSIYVYKDVMYPNVAPRHESVEGL